MAEFVLRKKGTNDCITGLPNGRAVIRNCDESILQRPNRTIFTNRNNQSPVTPGGPAGNLNTIVKNPKGMNLNRADYTGTVPFNDYVFDVEQDTFSLLPNDTGDGIAFGIAKNNTPGKWKLGTDGVLSADRIGPNNIISRKFANNKYAKDIIDQTNSAIASAAVHSVGTSSNSAWNELLDGALMNNPVVDYIKKTIEKIKTPNYSYTIKNDMSQLKYTVRALMTEADMAKITFGSGPQGINSVAQIREIDGVTMAVNDIFAVYKTNSVNIKSSYPQAPIGMFRIYDTNGSFVWIDGFANQPSHNFMRGVIFYVSSGQKYGNKYFKLMSVKGTNGIIPVEIKETEIVTAAADDIYNYQDDPEIGILYNRDIPRPAYKFYDPAEMPLRYPTLGNETHPYYQKCQKDPYCMDDCYGKPAKNCEINNVAVFDNDINDFARYSEPHNLWDNRAAFLEKGADPNFSGTYTNLGSGRLRPGPVKKLSNTTSTLSAMKTQFNNQNNIYIKTIIGTIDSMHNEISTTNQRILEQYIKPMIMMVIAISVNCEVYNPTGNASYIQFLTNLYQYITNYRDFTAAQKNSVPGLYFANYNKLKTYINDGSLDYIKNLYDIINTTKTIYSINNLRNEYNNIYTQYLAIFNQYQNSCLNGLQVNSSDGSIASGWFAPWFITGKVNLIRNIYGGWGNLFVSAIQSNVNIYDETTSRDFIVNLYKNYSKTLVTVPVTFNLDNIGITRILNNFGLPTFDLLHKVQ